MCDWTIGCDAEIMLVRDGVLVSAVDLLPSSTEPLPLPYGGIFYDNVLAEFTIEPAKNKQTFVKHLQGNLQAAKAMFARQGLGVRIVSSARYPKEELQSVIAKQFACVPDFDAYTLKSNEPYAHASKTTLRSAGAHIHVGHEVFGDPSGECPVNAKAILEMVKMMDLYLGLPSLSKDNTKEARERRKLYGKAGAHRPKPYPGVEYRTLSNFWISTVADIEWVYDQTAKALTKIIEGETVVSMGVMEEELQMAINTGKPKLVREVT